MQREKIVFELVQPFIAGFSVEPMEIDTGDDQTPIKRKSDECATTSSDQPMAESSIPSKTAGKKNKKSKK